MILVVIIAYVLWGSMEHIVKMVCNKFSSLCSMFIQITPYISLEINECESTPCSNGATCVDLLDSYHCICVFGYNGTHCHHGTTKQCWYFQFFLLTLLLCSSQNKMNVKAIHAQMVAPAQIMQDMQHVSVLQDFMDLIVQQVRVYQAVKPYQTDLTT